LVRRAKSRGRCDAAAASRFLDECNHRAGVMRLLAGVIVEKVEPQDWHACRIM
jgi:hypothetical protein